MTIKRELDEQKRMSIKNELEEQEQKREEEKQSDSSMIKNSIEVECPHCGEPWIIVTDPSHSQAPNAQAWKWEKGKSIEERVESLKQLTASFASVLESLAGVAEKMTEEIDALKKY